MLAFLLMFGQLVIYLLDFSNSEQDTTRCR
jgi:hypothetical protein